jgi:chromosome segregation ATPase
MRTTPSADPLRIQVIEQYLAEIREEELQADEDIKRISVRIESLRAERVDLEKTLAHLQRRAGIVVSTPANERKNDSEAKGELFERFAEERREQGFTITEIFKLYSDQKIEIGRNYPYFLVDMRYKDCLRKVGATRNGKRYYWTKNGTASH